MPEFLEPGIYVEQSDPDSAMAAPAPPRLDHPVLEALAADVRLALRTHVPDWTDSNDSDPGTTLLEVMAFLAEGLTFRADLSERARLAAWRAASALSALARDGSASVQGLERPVFFSGQLLDAATLTAEQGYHREKLRRHNRALIGYGTVSGLDVRVDDTEGSGGPRLEIEPGVAIDRRGEELSLPCPVRVKLRAPGGVRFVTLGFQETPRPGAAVRFIEEACVIGIHPEVAAPTVPLARLIHSNGRWRIDSHFQRPRTGSAGHP
ncbi:MAG: hypothetical protein LC796_16185 [Acidobacteria bacterium]|nr:hypothetical protein [Acidobacteriota bacterium]MCA1611331.1 hypothetical protein [Acidobacteriota bacterium]